MNWGRISVIPKSMKNAIRATSIKAKIAAPLVYTHGAGLLIFYLLFFKIEFL
jgi:hypothetical protein